jgi:K+-transporting ATPase KdpF subunit
MWQILFYKAEPKAHGSQMFRRYSTPLSLLAALLLNLAIAPLVLASSGSTGDRGTAYALGLLGIVIVGLVGYLFVVIFQPERF